MAIQYLTHWLALDILLIVVSCKLTTCREQDSGYLQNLASRSRDIQNGRVPLDDPVLRYYLYYMSQMANNRLTNQRQQNDYDRGVKRIGSEFLGKRSSGVNQWTRGEDMDEPTSYDKRFGSEFIGKRLGSEFIGKRLGSEFIGKRLGSEFIGKRLGSEFIGKRLGSEFVGKRSGNYAESDASESGNSEDWNVRSGNLNKNHSEGLE